MTDYSLNKLIAEIEYTIYRIESELNHIKKETQFTSVDEFNPSEVKHFFDSIKRIGYRLKSISNYCHNEMISNFNKGNCND